MSGLTAGGGQEDWGIGAKFQTKISSRKIRVWFVRSDGTSATFVRKVRVSYSGTIT